MLFASGREVSAVESLLAVLEESGDDSMGEEGVVLLRLGEFAATARTHTPDTVIAYLQRSLALAHNQPWKPEALYKLYVSSSSSPPPLLLLLRQAMGRSVFEERFVRDMLEKQRSAEYKTILRLHQQRKEELQQMKAALKTRSASMSVRV